MRHHRIFHIQLQYQKLKMGLFNELLYWIYWYEGTRLRIIKITWPFFRGSLHKIKFLIFQNIYKCSIHGLRTFNYNIICELCDKSQEKEKSGKIMAKKSFVLYERVIDVIKKTDIPTIFLIWSISYKDYWFNGMW